MDFIVSINPLVDIITRVVMAGAAIFGAWLAYYKLIKAGKPKVEVFLRPHDIHFSVFMFCIENVGAGPAYDIQFADVSFKPDGNVQLSIPLDDIGFFKKGITYLGTGERIEHFLVSSIGNLDKLVKSPLKMSITYRDSKTKDSPKSLYNEDFCLDFGEFEGLTRIGKAPLVKIADATEKIQQDLNRILMKSLALHDNAIRLISEGSQLVRVGDKVKTRKKLLGKVRDSDHFVHILEDEVCTVLEATMSSLIVEYDADSKVVYHGNPHHFLTEFELLE